MIYDLVDEMDPILQEQMPVFDFKDPPIDPVELATNLTETMLKNNGMGLAAPQCGLRYRCFVVAANPVIAVFNPRILDYTKTEELQIKLDEGCLTYPNIFLKVNRPRIIKVRYTMPNGQFTTEQFHGMTSRIFQHEFDHLEGVTMFDHVSRLQADRARTKAKKRLSKLVYNV